MPKCAAVRGARLLLIKYVINIWRVIVCSLTLTYVALGPCRMVAVEDGQLMRPRKRGARHDAA